MDAPEPNPDGSASTAQKYLFVREFRRQVDLLGYDVSSYTDDEIWAALATLAKRLYEHVGSTFPDLARMDPPRAARMLTRGVPMVNGLLPRLRR